MRLPIPWNDAFPQFQLIIRTPAGERILTVDDTHREVDIPIPPGVSEEDVEILGLGLGHDGQPLPGFGSVLIKAAVERPAPALEPEPVVEPQSEPDPVAEPEAEYPRRRWKPAPTAAAEAASET